MGDGLVIALASILAVGIPLVVSAFNSRKTAATASSAATEAASTADIAAAAATAAAAAVLAATSAANDAATEAAEARRAAHATAETLGVSNGKGDVVTMLTKNLAQNEAMLRWQAQHARDDDARIAALMLSASDLATYTRESVTELKHLLTPNLGTVTLLNEAGLLDQADPKP